jgi:hypothetical protein
VAFGDLEILQGGAEQVRRVEQEKSALSTFATEPFTNDMRRKRETSKNVSRIKRFV